eukprot:4137634-Prymnesium_polylepis.2
MLGEGPHRRSRGPFVAGSAPAGVESCLPPGIPGFRRELAGRAARRQPRRRRAARGFPALCALRRVVVHGARPILAMLRVSITGWGLADALA